ncbi:heme-binding protein [Vibrio ostreicida]|uniref:Heme-binding protein n=1 Tax=Vibrio ostreicida TaxID=526588 RepID=A0ABT8C1J1_9VIBR|nr:heme-binding protein [Vibrio ostreicida]MDN3612202.1 heme-binding protein [Vibrio ostreicida]NPD08596.1 heme-binding protein [Vibrio ostreicida]
MKTMKLTLLATSLGLLATSFHSLAEDQKHTVSVLQISSKSALTLAAEALHQCEMKGYTVSATVVDVSGDVLAQVRSDGAGVHTLESSRKKAFTVASIKQPSANLMTLIAEKPILAPLQNMDENLLFLAGGVPVLLDNQLIGAIGVGGAPGGHLDVACAEAALKTVF